MDNPSGGRDARYAALGYNMGMMGGDAGAEMYGRPSTSQLSGASQLSRGGGATMMTTGGATPGVGLQRGMKRSASDVVCYEDANVRQSMSQGQQGMTMTGECVQDSIDESFTNLGAPKKSPPSNGKKTKGRVKIKMEYIDNKLRRYTTFSKRKTGIMKKVRFSHSFLFILQKKTLYFGRDPRLACFDRDLKSKKRREGNSGAWKHEKVPKLP